MINNLKITEIFYSLQGETRTTGLPTVFIRLTGCPLRCQYCDTAYAFHGGNRISLNDILIEVQKYNTKYVTITGGEPLAQPNCLPLMSALCDKGYKVSIETSGALDVSKIDPRVIKIIDLKTPGSLEEKRNLWGNLDYLQAHDQIKFVICNENDYNWAKQQIETHQIDKKVEVLLSPSYGQQNPQDLAQWILNDQLNVRFQLQLHKQLWNDEAGR